MGRAGLYLLLSLLCVARAEAAKPAFENATPVGFSPQDSTVRQNFTVGQKVSVRVDLDRAATYD